MKSLNLHKVRTEFIMLTLFHGQNFISKMDSLQVDSEIKLSMKKLVEDFLRDLIEVSEFDPKSEDFSKINSIITSLY